MTTQIHTEGHGTLKWRLIGNCLASVAYKTVKLLKHVFFLFTDY